MNSGSNRCSVLAGAAVLALAGCGSSTTPAGPRPATGARAGPALGRAPTSRGEVVVRADGAPLERGPFEFHGRYRVRFEQRAPEDPRLDFAGQTAFSARLSRPAANGAGTSRRLFEKAAARGSTVVRIDGSWRVSVDFGDFPFALRFTPVR